MPEQELLVVVDKAKIKLNPYKQKNGKDVKGCLLQSTAIITESIL